MGDKRCTNEKCQAVNSNVSKFCMKCGTPLQDAVSVEEKKVAEKPTHVEESRKRTVTKSSKGHKKPLLIGSSIVTVALVLFVIAGILLAGKGKFEKQVEAAFEDNNVTAFAELVKIPSKVKGTKKDFASLIENDFGSIQHQIIEGTAVLAKQKGDTSYTLYSNGIAFGELSQTNKLLFFPSYEIILTGYDLGAITEYEGVVFNMNNADVSLPVGDTYFIGKYIPGKYSYTALAENEHGKDTYEGSLLHPNNEDSTLLSVEFETYDVHIASDYVKAVVYIDGKSTEKTIDELPILEGVPETSTMEITAKLSVDDETYDADVVFNTSTDRDLYFTFEKYEQNLIQQELLNEEEIKRFFVNYRSDFEEAIAAADFNIVGSFFMDDAEITEDYKEFVNDHRDLAEYNYQFLRNDIENVEKVDDRTFNLLSTEEFNFTLLNDGTYHYNREKQYVIVYDEDKEQLVIADIKLLNTIKTRK